MPNGDAVTTPIMHPADFLTESFLSRIKDKQENGAKILKFSNSHKRKRERDCRFFIVVSLHRQTGMTALFDLLLHTEKNRKAGSKSEGHNFESLYPITTSSTIISTKPTAKPMVLRLECRPLEASGISSSTTT